MLLAGDKNAWKKLLCHANPGVTLVVLEQHIVARLELLDETILKVESFLFAVDHNVLHVPNVAHKQIGAPQDAHG